MIGKKTLDVNPIPAAEVKEILEEFSEKNELSYEQNLTLAHVTNFQKLPLEDTEKLIEELESIVKTKYAIRIADLMPKDIADLRLIFAKEKFPMKKDEMEDVLKILNKYQKIIYSRLQNYLFVEYM